MFEDRWVYQMDGSAIINIKKVQFTGYGKESRQEHPKDDNDLKLLRCKNMHIELNNDLSI